jgi:hypothetical protein
LRHFSGFAGKDSSGHAHGQKGGPGQTGFERPAGQERSTEIVSKKEKAPWKKEVKQPALPKVMLDERHKKVFEYPL